MFVMKITAISLPSRLIGWLILFSVLVVSCRSGDSGPVAVDPSQLESFADEFFPEQMEDLHIPGLILIVVQDGHILLAKGYGSSNLERGEIFSPDQTIVRIGSVSKLFVATSVM